MGLDLARYHSWHGKLRAPWIATLSIVRVALIQILRRKMYWFILAIGLLQFLQFFAVVFALTQMRLNEGMRERLIAGFGFTAAAAEGQENGYTRFMERQSVVVVILLAFAGSTLVGADFHQGALPFYLSRRIDRRHYIAGKLLATSVLVLTLTVVPALALFLEFGLLSSSLDYWFDHLPDLVAIATYGAVLCLVLSVWLVTLAAYLQRIVPIVITWASLFFVLYPLTDWLAVETSNPRWKLLDPWHNIYLASRLGFDTLDHAERQLAYGAVGVLVGLCAVSLLLLFHRVRAVEIVN